MPEMAQREFSIGDHVIIRSKSIGMPLEEFQQSCGTNLNNKIIHRKNVKSELNININRGFDIVSDTDFIYTINGNYFLAQDLILERSNVTMDWRSVQSDELTGKRVKCTWQTNGTLECTHSHIFTGFVGEVQSKLIKIEPTGSNFEKPVLIGKDSDGWLIIRSATTLRSRRGTEQKVFYQAVCPEHVAEYEAQVAIEEQQQAEEQARRQLEERQRAAEQEARRIREAEEEARRMAERRVRLQREEAERQQREEQQRLNAEKYNIWSFHEKGKIE